LFPRAACLRHGRCRFLQSKSPGGAAPISREGQANV
jgi:hypothetical protein